MTKTVKVEMPSGQVIWAHVATGPSDVSMADVVQKLRLEDLKSSIHAVATSVREATVDLTPDEVAVEFGLELELKSGKLTSVLAEAGATASIRITMTWSSGATSPGAADQTATA